MLPSESRREYNRWHLANDHTDDIDTPWVRLTRRAWDRRDIEGRRVLEIGCGRGGFARWLARQEQSPSKLIACDFALSGVGRLPKDRQQLAAKVAWATADIQALPFGSDTFDTVLSFETIEHVPQPQAAVAELARVLRPGGRLFLTCPNYLNLSGLYRIYLRLRGRRFQEAGQPVNQPLILPWTRRLVTRAGLQIENVSSAQHLLLLPGVSPYVMRSLEGRRGFAWLGVQGLIVARKPSKEHG